MRSTVADKARAALRRAALGYPETREDFPWGECVIKVRNKVFVFLGKEGSELGLSVKLPHSGLMALSLPFASPTGYGLAKGGWVTARFGPRDKPPMDILLQWLDESYRAVAPKKLAAGLSAHEAAPPARPPARKTRAPRSRPRSRGGKPRAKRGYAK